MFILLRISEEFCRIFFIIFSVCRLLNCVSMSHVCRFSFRLFASHTRPLKIRALERESLEIEIVNLIKRFCSKIERHCENANLLLCLLKEFTKFYHLGGSKTAVLSQNY